MYLTIKIVVLDNLPKQNREVLITSHKPNTTLSQPQKRRQPMKSKIKTNINTKLNTEKETKLNNDRNTT